MWNDTRVALLKKLWAEGLSTSQIAADLGGVTRNAVIGKVHRLKLPAPVRSERAPVKPRAPKPHKSGPVIVQRIANRDAPSILPTMPQPTGTVQRCTVLELNSRNCHWPFGEPQSPDFFFCGGDAVDGKPYCAGHCDVAYKARAA